MTNRRLTDEDRRIWRQVSKTVKPLADRPPVKTDADVDIVEAPAAPRAAGPKRVGGRIPPRPAAAPPPKTAPPADVGGEKKVRRGRAVIDARLDLHGHTQDSARGALAHFLSQHRADGARCVLVITGKGRLGAGVLKARFLDWLSDPELRAHISGYAQAHKRHGGGGAYYVFLKRREMKQH